MAKLSTLFERVYSDSDVDWDTRVRAAARLVSQQWDQGWGVGCKNPTPKTVDRVQEYARIWVRNVDCERGADSQAAARFEYYAHGNN